MSEDIHNMSETSIPPAPTAAAAAVGEAQRGFKIKLYKHA